MLKITYEMRNSLTKTTIERIWNKNVQILKTKFNKHFKKQAEWSDVWNMTFEIIQIIQDMRIPSTNSYTTRFLEPAKSML